MTGNIYVCFGNIITSDTTLFGQVSISYGMGALLIMDNDLNFL